MIEHKSYQDFQTIFQLWGYVYLICLREYQAAEQRGENMATYRHPPIVAIIVHHGATKFKGATELAEMFVPIPGLEQYFPGLRAILFDLSNIVRLMYSRQDQWRDDALLTMFGNKPWSFDRPPYLRGKLVSRVNSPAKQLPGQRRTQMRLLKSWESFKVEVFAGTFKKELTNTFGKANPRFR